MAATKTTIMTTMANGKATTVYSTQAEVDEAHRVLHQTFASGLTKDLAWRKWQLKQLWWLVEDNTDRIVAALAADLNRHALESMSADVMALKMDILGHIKHLEKWTATQPTSLGFPGLHRIFKARVRKEPLGVTLIIGAWNYPVLLLLQPLVAAIAAGCCALLKPSELSGHCERLLHELVPAYLDPRALRLVTGGAAETGYILSKPFNHIFFTGSSKVARIVAAAAAKHLTPLVLELGGQGPAIVTRTADVDLAARRIAYAKYTNAGQICLSVNHVFVDPAVLERFLDRVAHYFSSFTAGGDGRENMTRIVNDRNLERLAALLAATKGTVVHGGEVDRATRHFVPTVVRDVKLDDPLLSEELFGPILPVIAAPLDEAIRAVNSLPSPLALYLFSRDRREIDSTLDRTLSGGVTVNNVFFHSAVGDAPFGGVGESGYGAYHGRHGVDCFSHKRAVMEPPSWIDRLMGFAYPPYKMENVKKIHVANNLGFRRGETMEDQRKGKGVALPLLLVLAVAVAAGAAASRGDLKSLESFIRRR